MFWISETRTHDRAIQREIIPAKQIDRMSGQDQRIQLHPIEINHRPTRIIARRSRIEHQTIALDRIQAIPMHRIQIIPLAVMKMSSVRSVINQLQSKC